MLSIGPLEMAVIALVTLLVVGPQKLPEVARQFGRFFIQAKRATADIRSQVDEFMRETEASVIKEEHDKLRQLISSELNEVKNSAKNLLTDVDQEAHIDDNAESGFEGKPYYDPELEAADRQAEEAARAEIETDDDEQAPAKYQRSENPISQWDTEQEQSGTNDPKKD